MKDITEYLNYREFLKDWIAARKEEGLPGSNRWFASRMGINSTSWLSSILSGSRNLNDTHLSKLISVLKLTPKESSFFSALVAFNQAKEHEEKGRIFETIKKIQSRKETQTITGQFYDYYQNWYNSAIRALIGLHPFSGDYAALGAELFPPISEATARESVALLERIGLIVQKDGQFELTSAGITTGEYEKSIAITSFQEETLGLAKAALHRFPKESKDISTLTLGISRGNIDQVKEILRKARQEIASIAECDDDADSVYQLNMQLFPLSKNAAQFNGDSK